MMGRASGRFPRLAGFAALAATLGLVALISASQRPTASQELLTVPRGAILSDWLGEHWYIDGLEDDGKYMRPSTPEDESSGNALFDFGNGNGLPLSKSTGEPEPGLLHNAARRWRKTGTSEEHFPNEIYQFDVDGIRRYVLFISARTASVFTIC